MTLGLVNGADGKREGVIECAFKESLPPIGVGMSAGEFELERGFQIQTLAKLAYLFSKGVGCCLVGHPDGSKPEVWQRIAGVPSVAGFVDKSWHDPNILTPT